jgi:hypothetical protein
MICAARAIAPTAGGDRWRRNKMKKLFISQPMRGKTNEEIMLVREKAIKSTERELGERVEVIDSFFKDAPHDAQPLWYLGESLKLLSTADVAYFAKGWGGARGCRIEHQCAIDYEIELVIEDYTDEAYHDRTRTTGRADLRMYCDS